jgi:hypothetical protein
LHPADVEVATDLMIVGCGGLTVHARTIWSEQQPLHPLAAKQVPVQNFRNVLLCLIVVPDAFRVNHKHRPVLAQIEAARKVDPNVLAATFHHAATAHVVGQRLRAFSSAASAAMGWRPLVDAAENMHVVHKVWIACLPTHQHSFNLSLHIPCNPTFLKHLGRLPKTPAQGFGAPTSNLSNKRALPAKQVCFCELNFNPLPRHD